MPTLFKDVPKELAEQARDYADVIIPPNDVTTSWLLKYTELSEQIKVEPDETQQMKLVVQKEELYQILQCLGYELHELQGYSMGWPLPDRYTILEQTAPGERTTFV